VPGAIVAPASPPWQSVQPNRTVRVGCMVGSSTFTWQLTQPALFRSASACVCVIKLCRAVGAVCDGVTAGEADAEDPD
jgi:hypothetical protein